jgi:hypothetical protein
MTEMDRSSIESYELTNSFFPEGLSEAFLARRSSSFFSRSQPNTPQSAKPEIDEEDGSDVVNSLFDAIAGGE